MRGAPIIKDDISTSLINKNDALNGDGFTIGRGTPLLKNNTRRDIHKIGEAVDKFDAVQPMLKGGL
jgi:hypothetical protein